MSKNKLIITSAIISLTLFNMTHVQAEEISNLEPPENQGIENETQETTPQINEENSSSIPSNAELPLKDTKYNSHDMNIQFELIIKELNKFFIMSKIRV